MNARLTLEEILDQVRRLSDEERQRLVADLQANAGRSPSEDRRRQPCGDGSRVPARGTRTLTTSRATRTGIWQRSTRRSRETGVSRECARVPLRRSTADRLRAPAAAAQ